MMCRINNGATKIWLLSALFASTSAVGTLFDCSFTKETGFSGNGKCSLWMNETASRPSALHASISQTASFETLGTTPAIALGITNHVWSISELIDAALTAAPMKPTPTAPDRRRRFRVIEGGKG